MITFSKLGEYGRLGNQLFQYAAVRALSLENGYDMIIPNPMDKVWQGQRCLLDCFNIPSSLIGAPSGLQYSYAESDPFTYDSNFWHIPDNTDIHGFFQSTLYFGNHSSIIKKELTPKKDFMSSAFAFVDSIRKKENKPVVSIHLRRGDNTDHSNPSERMNKMYDKEGDYFKYLNKALAMFPDCCFLVFTGGKRVEDENDDDIRWCKDNLGFSAYYSGGSTMEDFCRIMMCDHTIMSPISSFGWWAAYLSVSGHKKVVAPIKYHSDLEGYTYREGFYPTITVTTVKQDFVLL